MNNKNYFKHFLACAGVAAVLVLSATGAMADSTKELFVANGHYYQKFTTIPKLWNDAKRACELKGAHLVTVTSNAENDFLSIFPANDNYVLNWFGGRQVLGKWTWVTGEQFIFTAFVKDGKNNEFLGGFYTSLKKWQSSKDNELPYICEWEPKNYTSVISLPDLNGNSSPESAALYIDTKTYSHNVNIKDTDTQESIRTITFDTWNVISPIDMTQVSDMDGNGAPEIAVMYWTKQAGAINPMIGLMIKDASTGAASRSTPISILSGQYKAISLTTTPDITGDGIDELEVLVQKYSDSTVSSLIIDPVAGTVVKTIKF